MARDTGQGNPGSRQQRGPYQSDPTRRASAPRGSSGQGSTGTSTSTRTGEQAREIRTQREEGARGRMGTEVTRRPAVQGPFGGPFTVMQRLASDVDRLFEQFGFGRAGFGVIPSFGRYFGEDVGFPADRGVQAVWSPQIEVTRQEDQVVVRADLPGLDRDDLRIEIENDLLTLSGERRAEEEEEREGFFRSERSYGRFQRTIALPEGANADQAQATYKDGVLEVTVPTPKQETRKGKRIPVR